MNAGVPTICPALVSCSESSRSDDVVLDRLSLDASRLGSVSRRTAFEDSVRVESAC